MDYEALVSAVIEERKESPVDLRGMGDGEHEHAYLKDLGSSYVRTVRDIDRLLGRGAVLELGAFLGVVSVCLKRMGYAITASDIPEYSAAAPVYEKESIPFDLLNLRHHSLPYARDSFDAVVICETLEHFNFNPLPVLKEIHRVLKPGGCLYVGMPNQARLSNRLKALAGKSIHDPVSHFFQQLDRRDNMVVGIHWREFTLAETREMLERMGFSVERSYFFEGARYRWRRVIAAWPSLRSSQVVIARKDSDPKHDFWITEANA